MNDADIKNMWQQQDAGLSPITSFSNISKDKIDMTKKHLKTLQLRRAAEAILYAVTIALLVGYQLHTGQLSAQLSAAVLSTFAVAGLVASIRQIILIAKVDFGASVTDTQAQLEAIKQHKLKNIKLLIGSIPFYFAYIVIGFEWLLGIDILAVGNSAWLVSQGIFTIILAGFTIWLIRALRYDTPYAWIKKWLISENGGRSIYASLDFSAQLKALQQD